MKSNMAIVGTFAPFIQFCFLACYVAFVLAKPARGEVMVVSAAGAALGLAFVGLNLGTWISGLGLAAALWAMLAPFLKRKTVHPAIALLVLYPTIASAAMIMIYKNGGLVLDRYLLAADGSFGLQPGFLAAAFLLAHPAVKSICQFFYFGLPVAIASLFHTASWRGLVGLCLLLAVTAMLGYAAFPAIGAQTAFREEFPLNPPATNAAFAAPIFQPGGVARNFMPSLHTAWGIALVLAAWPLGPRWRAVTILYLVPMLFYTLASHYLCDLIVALPWTLAVWSGLEKRWGNLLANAAIAVGWMLLIRFGLSFLYASRAIPWLLCVATLGTLLLLRPRAKAVSVPMQEP